MTPRSSSGDDGLPLSDLVQIDEACDRFEAALSTGARPGVGVVPRGDRRRPPQRMLLRELLILDLEFPPGPGRAAPSVDTYRDRFPEHAEIINSVFREMAAGANRGSRAARPVRGTRAGPLCHSIRRPCKERVSRASPSSARTRSMRLREEGYEILGELGRGGMGVVYLAHKIALNRRCALKMILSGDHAGPMASARFRAEAETIARLRHPDIVQIYHVGEVNGLPFFELEYLPGGSLDRVLDGTPWPAAAASELIEVLAQRDRRGASPGDCPPGPEARQYLARRGAPTQGRRLRAGEDARFQ